MPPYKPVRIAALLSACLASAVAAAGMTSLQERKEQAVQSALAAATPAASVEEALARTSNAGALVGVAWRQGDGPPRLELTLEGAARPRVLPLEKGAKIVIDLHGAINLLDFQSLEIADRPGLRAVRGSLYAYDPEFIARVVLDWDARYQVEEHRVDDGVLYDLYPRRAPGTGRDAAETPAYQIHVVGALDSTPERSVQIETLAAQLEALTVPIFDKPAKTESKPRQESSLANVTSSLERVAAAAEQTATIEFIDTRVREHYRFPAGARDEEIDRVSAAGDFQATQPLAGLPLVLASLAEEMEAVDAEPVEEEALVEEAVEDELVDAPTPPGPREAQPAPSAGDANIAIMQRMRELTAGAAEETAPVRPAVAPLPAPVQSEPAPRDAPRPARPVGGDPLNMRVNLDFREMELSNVVALLAHKADINIIAGTDLTGVVTANLRDVPLRQAIETALRMNGLGMVEEYGIYYILPYSEAIAADRVTEMLVLDNAKSSDVQRVIGEIISGTPDERLITISGNDTANILVLSGPPRKIMPLIDMVNRLDVAEPVLPTVTEAVKLNYADPAAMMGMVEKMLTEDVGQVSADDRARHLIVTDVPVVVEQIRQLVRDLDVAVKQVVVDAMVVDVTLQDDADTGVDWLLQSVRRQSRRSAALDGPAVGNLQELAFDTASLRGGNMAGLLSYGVLSSRIDWRGIIQAEVRNQNGRLVSNPVVVTVENKPASISISQELPFIELTQTAAGGQQTSTSFKEIGTVLTVIPRVTHDNHIIVDLDAKESGTVGEFQGVPIEDKRELETTLRTGNGQTIFVGGLRKNDHDTTVRKVPVVGDIPVMNLLFRQNSRVERVNELLIFLTCSVLGEDLPDLNPFQQMKFDEGRSIETKADAQNALLHQTLFPHKMRDPVWAWRDADER